MTSSRSREACRRWKSMVSLLCGPLVRPTATAKTVPQANDNTTTRRATGKPSPGFWLPGWGYACWLASVSGMETPEPSTILTARPCQCQARGVCCWSPCPLHGHGGGQRCLGRALAGFAVPAGERRARREALGDARGVETRDRRPARRDVTVDCTQESPERAD